MNGDPWWVRLAEAVITAGPPTVAGLVLLRRLSVVHTAVNSGHEQTVTALAAADAKIAALSQELGKLKERARDDD